MNIFTTTYAYNSVALNSTTAPIFQNTTDPGDLVLLIISVFVLVSGVLSIMFILYITSSIIFLFCFSYTCNCDGWFFMSFIFFS